MKIALIGYGKMGKAIEALALAKGHQVIAKTGREGFSDAEVIAADVAIEFSSPQMGSENCQRLISMGIPTVSGTTGWTEDLPLIERLTQENSTSFLYASNFSLGVNLFFALNEQLANLMKDQPYQVSIEEIHHTQKLDAPSGTAISLAEPIIHANKTLKSWSLEEDSKENQLPIVAKRIDSTPGTHLVRYDSEIDTLEIKHTAHSRQGFAQGALLAAEWITDKQGVYSMKDLIKV